MNCNRNSAQAWERFTLVNAGNGKIALKGSNGRYVSSENGSSNGITCNRTAIGAWEAFTWGNTNGKVTLKGNNGRYISSENGGRTMTCNRTAVGAWEQFTVANTRAANTRITKTQLLKEIQIYPNPNLGIFTINFPKTTNNVSVTLVDVSGRIVYEDIISEVVEKTIDAQRLPKGIYILNVQGGDINQFQKLVIH